MKLNNLWHHLLAWAVMMFVPQVVVDAATQGYGDSSPPTFAWSTIGCSQGHNYCGTLTFCLDGSTYGYRMAGDSTCYSPGPLIRLIAGNTYELILANDSNAGFPTNVHTHGLHISGDAPSDDVRIVVPPGESHAYTWDLDANHPGGTNWYHSHKHEYSEEQVKNGALGLLIVEDNASDFSGSAPAWASNELNLQLIKQPSGGAHTANGKSAETFTVTPNEWSRLRLSYANYRGSGTDIDFEENIFQGSDCDIRKVANDGVWASTPGASANSFFLSGSSRADFAVRCNSPGDVINVKIGRKVFATITSTGPGSTGVPLESTYTIVRPPALSGLEGSVPSSNQKDIGMSGGNINVDGSSFTWDPTSPVATIPLNEVQEWTISGSSAHPFHLHLYHMMIVSGCDSDKYAVGEFYDTLESSSTCTVRFKTADFGGPMVMHCHVLSHEDTWAMVWMVVGGGGGGGPPGPAPATPGPTPPPTPGPTPGPTPTPTLGPTTGIAPPPPPASCDGVGTSCTRNPDSCCEGHFCPKGKKSTVTCQPLNRFLRGDSK